MQPETVPIVINRPDLDVIELYPIHDLHFGNEQFDEHKWNELTKMILSKPNAMVAFVGDLIENIVPNSRGDIFSQRYTPQEQQDFIVSVFRQFEGRIACVVDGNHEYNRSTRMCGLFPLFSACCIAGIEPLYRSAYAVIDLGIGNIGNRMSRAVGFVCHRAKELKAFSSVDALEGFDFMLTGHDHDPKDHARMHITYDRQRREIGTRSVEFVNCGSFLTFGGYGARNGYRPQSDKMYKLVLYAREQRKKAIETVGFYLD